MLTSKKKAVVILQVSSVFTMDCRQFCYVNTCRRCNPAHFSSHDSTEHIPCGINKEKEIIPGPGVIHSLPQLRPLTSTSDAMPEGVRTPIDLMAYESWDDWPAQSTGLSTTCLPWRKTICSRVSIIFATLSRTSQSVIRPNSSDKKWYTL